MSRIKRSLGDSLLLADIRGMGRIVRRVQTVGEVVGVSVASCTIVEAIREGVSALRHVITANEAIAFVMLRFVDTVGISTVRPRTIGMGWANISRRSSRLLRARPLVLRMETGIPALPVMVFILPVRSIIAIPVSRLLVLLRRHIRLPKRNRQRRVANRRFAELCAIAAWSVGVERRPLQKTGRPSETVSEAKDRSPTPLTIPWTSFDPAPSKAGSDDGVVMQGAGRCVDVEERMPSDARCAKEGNRRPLHSPISSNCPRISSDTKVGAGAVGLNYVHGCDWPAHMEAHRTHWFKGILEPRRPPI